MNNQDHHNVCIKTLIGWVVLLLVFSSQPLLASDHKVVIQNKTEDEIITKTDTYSLADNARVYDQNGKKVELWHLSTPCVARITLEPQPGQVPPVVTNISVIKLLPDLNLREYQNSRHPE
jgi:hypothetical protein